MSIQQNSIYSFKSVFQKTTINWENAPNIMLNEKIIKIWYKSYSNFICVLKRKLKRKIYNFLVILQIFLMLLFILFYV